MAERHRMVVLVFSVFSLLPIGVIIGQIGRNPPLLFALTMALAFACTSLLVRVLRRRFMNLFATSELDVASTLRQPDRKTSANVQLLTTYGFAIVDTVVVRTSAKVTLTRPLVLMRRPADNQIAQVNSMGILLTTLLDDATWLVTSTTQVVAHRSLRVERVNTGAAADAVTLHGERRAELQASGIGVGQQPGARAATLLLERFEQETVRGFRAEGTAAPSARALTSTIT